MVRIAGIDCGTNSVKMEVEDAFLTPSGLQMKTVIPRKVWTIRLGEGVEKTHRLSFNALKKLRPSLEGFKAEILSCGAEHLRFVATSAVRDAENAEEFRKIVWDVFKTEPEILTGEEEGKLGFEAACRGEGGGVKLLVDLGGGSTEFALGEGFTPSFVRSLNIGCVRMAEKFGFGPGPLSPAALESAGGFIRKAISGIPISRAQRLIGISGTIAVVSFMAAGEKEFSPYRKFEIERSKGMEVCEKLMGMSEEEMERYPIIPPLRRRVIRAGALIWREILAASDLNSYLFSDAALLDGVILDEAGKLLL
ncbi:MAG: hypothetical protein IIY17_00705 [Aeriscardovia sp.]|nr:hypothetical protein [Aeriscardovia sp.]